VVQGQVFPCQLQNAAMPMPHLLECEESMLVAIKVTREYHWSRKTQLDRISSIYDDFFPGAQQETFSNHNDES
jgi:hypothetical protein